MKKFIMQCIVCISYMHANNTMEQIFNHIYQTNYWGDKESVSGSGSNLKITETIRKHLPPLFQKLGIRSILDAPCGDFNWMNHVDLSSIGKYIGADIVQDIIEKNNHLYTNEKLSFTTLNIVEDPLPKVDLILCRDCLVHFIYKDIFRTLKNMVNSGSTYLVATTFTNRTENINLQKNGYWRPLNLEIEPFFLPKPLYIINENCTEADGIFDDKSLGVWRLSDIEPIINSFENVSVEN